MSGSKEERKNILLAKIMSMIETNSILEFRALINNTHRVIVNNGLCVK